MPVPPSPTRTSLKVGTSPDAIFLFGLRLEKKMLSNQVVLFVTQGCTRMSSGNFRRDFYFVLVVASWRKKQFSLRFATDERADTMHSSWTIRETIIQSDKEERMSSSVSSRFVHFKKYFKYGSPQEKGKRSTRLRHVLANCAQITLGPRTIGQHSERAKHEANRQTNTTTHEGA